MPVYHALPVVDLGDGYYRYQRLDLLDPAACDQVPAQFRRELVAALRGKLADALRELEELKKPQPPQPPQPTVVPQQGVNAALNAALKERLQGSPEDRQLAVEALEDYIRTRAGEEHVELPVAHVLGVPVFLSDCDTDQDARPIVWARYVRTKPSWIR